ncbi:hypothetical protein UA08_09134 [Talaromyces atroroseus]|uniref:Uncharacterized protein n=1 Tax=Talaromyces atroroseus TaxID=1441469 RepID=A0A1Q5Q6X3_TALAT|nr:hypothetical protein UA08_09134 [Talaromyces atroroseus]OKL55598.1 hypothetical protein UA08_09134 [Talaromyces atroroseus]
MTLSTSKPVCVEGFSVGSNGAAVTVDSSAGTELEDLTLTFADEDPFGHALCTGSAGPELEDLTMAFTDEDDVGNAVCAGSEIIWQVKLEAMVDLTEES